MELLTQSPDSTFEAVESPEYIKFCEDNHFGYTEGVDIVNMMGKQRTFSKDYTTGEWSASTIIWKHLPDWDGGMLVPYHISSANGTYMDPRDREAKRWNDAWQSGDLKYVFLGDDDKENEILSVYTDGKSIPESEHKRLYGK